MESACAPCAATSWRRWATSSSTRSSPTRPTCRAIPTLPQSGAERAWEGGPDGRALLDRLCAQAPRHLAPGGVLLVVHSSLCGTDSTLDLLREQGLRADVAVRHHGSLGPLLRARAAELESRDLLAAGQREEEVVVVRAAA